MRRNTYSLALGGIVAALCWSLLISSGLLPFMNYTMPAIAGFVLVAVAFENGSKWAYMTYVAVSLLAFFMATDLEAILLFIFLFGFYPTLRLRLHVMRPKWLTLILKFALFNSALALMYIALTHLFRLDYLLAEMRMLTPLALTAVWLFLNFVFWVYDKAVANMTQFYIVAIRPKIKQNSR